MHTLISYSMRVSLINIGNAKSDEYLLLFGLGAFLTWHSIKCFDIALNSWVMTEGVYAVSSFQMHHSGKIVCLFKKGSTNSLSV